MEQASPSGDLALKDLEPRHSGFYTCSLSNNVTQTHLTVHVSGGEVVGGEITARLHHPSVRSDVTCRKGHCDIIVTFKRLSDLLAFACRERKLSTLQRLW